MDTSNFKEEVSMEQAKRNLTVGEACEYLGCGKTTLYSLLDGQLIKAHYIGRGTRILTSSLDEYIEANAWKSRQCRG